jgi:hypothetical protein
MPKAKNKPLTRDEVRKMIRREVVKVVAQVIEETREKLAEKLEPAVGFKYIEANEIQDVEGY